MKIANDVKYIKLDDIWQKDIGQTSIEYNDLELSDVSCDGKGFYVNASIIAGPFQGKAIESDEAYGNWKTSLEGELICDGAKMTVIWSPAIGKIYISHVWDLSKVSKIEIKKGTVLTPLPNGNTEIYARIANDITFVKDTRYNRWVLDGQQNTDYNFCDVQVKVKNITGNVLELQGSFINNPGVPLKNVYGDWSTLYGAVTLDSPEKGVYINENAVYSLAGTGFFLYGIQSGMQNGIEIKAGTILWPDADCNSQEPIRIVNTIKMTRDSEDEWVIDNGSWKEADKSAQNVSSGEEQKAEDKKENSDDVKAVNVKVQLVNRDKEQEEIILTVPATNGITIWVIGGIAFLVLAGCISMIVIVKKRKKAA